MWQYNHIPEPTISDVIKHYGVLGMKWGVRKDPSKAYRKASRKMDKLRTKAEKKKAKADKAAARTWTWNPFKYSSSQIGAKAKAAAKAIKRAQRWERNMTKTFQNVSVSQISKEDLAAGQQYVNMLRRDS